MRKGILGSLAVLTAGAGLTFGQPKAPPPMPGAPHHVPPPGVVPPPGAPAAMPPDGPLYLPPPGYEGMMPPGPPMYGDPMGAPEGPYGSGGGIFGKKGPKKFWLIGEYLFWAPSSMTVNYPVVTTSAALDFGVIFRPTTASIGPGDRSISFDATNGFRTTAGVNLDESGEIGAEASGFWLEKASRSYNFGGNEFGLPVLALPYFNVNNGAQGSYIVSFPGINTGAINVQAESRVWGVEGSLVYNAYGAGDGPGGLTLLIGPRYLQLREQFSVSTTSTTFGVPPFDGVLGSSFFPGGGGVFAGAFFGPALAPYTATTTDIVKTANDFWGGQVGFRGDIGFGSWFVQLVGKFGAGYMRQRVDIEGSTTFTAAGVTSNQPGGFYNLPQDLFRHRRDQFAVLGEAGVNVGYQVGSFLRVFGGYSFLWVNNVVRPTRSTTPMLNPNLIPISPTFDGTAPANGLPRDITGDTDYHLQGFNVGVQISF
jgi:hypothetical protein